MSSAIEAVELSPRQSSEKRSLSKPSAVKDGTTVEAGDVNYMDLDGLGTVKRDESVGDYDADESPFAEGMPRIYFIILRFLYLTVCKSVQ